MRTSTSLAAVSVAVLLLGLVSAGCVCHGTCGGEARYVRTVVYAPPETVYVYPQRSVVYVPAPPPPSVVFVRPGPCPPPAYVVTERYYGPCRQSAVLPSTVAGALIGAGTAHHGHGWSGAGRGALVGAGVGVLIDVLNR